jgi:hypothetical protein
LEVKSWGWARTALVIWMDMSSWLPRSVAGCLSALVAAVDDVEFVLREVLEAVFLRLVGVCGRSLVRISKEEAWAEVVVLEKISVYRFCTWLGDRKTSSSESWISSMFMYDGGGGHPTLADRCWFFLGVVLATSSVRVAGSVGVTVDAVFLGFVFAFGLGLELEGFVAGAAIISPACAAEGGREETPTGWSALPCFDSQHFRSNSIIFLRPLTDLNPYEATCLESSASVNPLYCGIGAGCEASAV